MGEIAKGCPGCGGRAGIDETQGRFSEVRCTQCGLNTGLQDSTSAALTLWNTRHADPLTEAKVELANAVVGRIEAEKMQAGDATSTARFEAAKDRVEAAYDALLVAKGDPRLAKGQTPMDQYAASMLDSCIEAQRKRFVAQGALDAALANERRAVDQFGKLLRKIDPEAFLPDSLPGIYVALNARLLAPAPPESTG